MAAEYDFREGERGKYALRYAEGAKVRVPNFHGQVLAVNRVERLLRKATSALDAAGLPYAVVGGNAVAAWVATVDEGAVRATKDVDILIRRPDLLAIADALRAAGLISHEVLGVTMFLTRRKPNPKTGLHVVFAAEKVRPSDLHPAPELTATVRSDSGFAVLSLPELVCMKLIAFRDIDRVHIRDLLSLSLIDDEVIAQLLPDLRERLREIQATPE